MDSVCSKVHNWFKGVLVSQGAKLIVGPITVNLRPFLATFYLLTSTNIVQITWHFQRKWSLFSYISYVKVTITEPYLEIWHFSKEQFSVKLKKCHFLQFLQFLQIWSKWLNFKNVTLSWVLHDIYEWLEQQIFAFVTLLQEGISSQIYHMKKTSHEDGCLLCFAPIVMFSTVFKTEKFLYLQRWKKFFELSGFKEDRSDDD